MKSLKPGFFSTLSRAALALGITSAAAHVTTAPARADFKLVTVDVNRVLNESKGSQSKRKQLEKLSEDAKKKIEDKRKPLADLQAKLKAAKVEENSKEAEKFRDQARDFERYVKDTEDDLKKKFIEINKDLTEQVMKEIRKYAEAKNIQMVLDKSEKGRGPVLFGSPSADITDDIIQAMNSK